MRNIFLTILISLLIGGGGTYLWVYYGGFGQERATAIVFVDAYGAYEELAKRVAELVRAPGERGNVNRAELERLLAEILTKPIEPDARDALARIAFEHIDILRKDIETASREQEMMYQLVQQLDNSARVFNGVRIRTMAESVVLEVRTQAEISARLIALLTLTHEYTYAIITRILQDGGELTDAHKTAINEMTPEAELRHDALVRLYADFSASNSARTQKYQEFIKQAL